MHQPVCSTSSQPFNLAVNCRWLLLCATMLVLQQWIGSQAHAGCRYTQLHHNLRANQPSLGASSDGSSQSHDGHVRNFQFLGQWVYERGDIKYVPWQSEPSCDGPNCHANPEPPVSTTGAPTATSRSVAGAVLFLVERRLNTCALTHPLSLVDEPPSEGHPASFEYPP